MKDYFKVIPDEIIAQIIQIGQVDTDVAWAYGKIILDVQSHLLASGYEASMYECTEFVQRTSGEIRSVQTMYRYALVAKFYSQHDIEEYRQHPLSFSHFEFAMGQREKWADVLDYCVEYIAEHGYPPSISYLYAFKNSVADKKTEEEVEQIFRPEPKRVEKVVDKDVDEKVERLQRIADELEPELEQIIEITKRLDGMIGSIVGTLWSKNYDLAQKLARLRVVCKHVVREYNYTKNSIRQNHYVEY